MELGTQPLLADFVARRYARPSPPVTWWVCQPIGGFIAYLSHRGGIRPAALTFGSLLFGVIGCAVFMSAETPGLVLLAGGLLALSYIFDCADGQLARATGTTSYRGAWLDIVVDSTIVVSLALAVHSQSRDDPQAVAFVAALLLGGGRVASLLTTSLSRRSAERAAWQSRGVVRVLRVAYISVIDTPVAYLLLVITAAVEVPLYFTASVLGAASFVHAVVIGNRIYPVDAPLDQTEVPRPAA